MDVTLHLILGYLKILLQLHRLYSIEWQNDCEWWSIERIRKEAVVTYTVRAFLWRDNQSQVCNSKPERRTHEAPNWSIYRLCVYHFFTLSEMQRRGFKTNITFSCIYTLFLYSGHSINQCGFLRRNENKLWKWGRSCMRGAKTSWIF